MEFERMKPRETVCEKHQQHLCGRCFPESRKESLERARKVMRSCEQVAQEVSDAAKELERRELKKIIEGLKMARMRTLPGHRTLVNLGHIPDAVRAVEWVRMDIEGEIAELERRLADLSKRPVETEEKRNAEE